MSGDPQTRRPIVYAEFADYDRATGGYVYNARLCNELAGLGWSVNRLELPPGFPELSGAASEEIARLLAAIPDGSIVMIDQVCLGPIVELALHQQTARLHWIEIFHHPMVHDLPHGSPAWTRVDQIERAALDVPELIITSSESTARTLLADYSVPASMLVTAPPGFERVQPNPARAGSGPIRLLSVGAIVPRKGYLALIEALAGLPMTTDWSLHIVGNPDRDPGHAAAIAAQIVSIGLGDRVRLMGKLSDNDLAREWAAADLYVSASEHEGFGMAVGEAVMRGLPVVTTSAGAVGDWLGRDCAIVLPNGDVAALRTAIAALIEQPERRVAMRRAALVASAALPTWPASASIVSEALAAR